MTLRKTLIFSTFISVFTGFVLSSLILIFQQKKEQKVELETQIQRLTEMVCTTNVAYAWGYDTIGLQNSLDAMIKDPQIISITVEDYMGNPMASASEDVIGNIFEVEQIMSMDNMDVGNAKIVFTDYYIVQKYIKTLREYFLLEVFLFLVVVVTLMIASGIVFKRPIQNLTNVVKDMAQGEGDLTVRIPIKRHNELAELSSYFNSLLDKLHTSLSNLQNVGESSKALGLSLDTNTKELSNSVSGISRNMNEVNDRIAVMNEEIETSENNVSRINEFIHSVVDMIKEQSDSVEKSSTAIRTMISNVSDIETLTETKLSKVVELEKEAGKLENDAKINVKQMITASESTREIINMVGVINDIAARTNLLAMNAAIEASHAGIAGKGFSVVASEIRKLAEQTAENSKKIETTISEIVEQISAATKTSQDSSLSLTTVLTEISDVANGLNDTLAGLKDISAGNEEIVDVLEDLNSLTNSVTSSSEEMRRGTEEIKNSISKIMNVTGESRREIDDMTQGLSKVSDAMIDLTHLSKDNSNNIDALEIEIKKFKL